MGGVLGHIGGSTAVFTAQCQALQQAQHDQDDGGRHADRSIRRQDAHDERGQAHDQDGDQERVLAADHVAQAAEEDGAERTNNEARRKSQQCEDERRTGIQTAEELLGNDGCQRTV